MFSLYSLLPFGSDVLRLRYFFHKSIVALLLTSLGFELLNPISVPTMENTSFCLRLLNSDMMEKISPLKLALLKTTPYKFSSVNIEHEVGLSPSGNAHLISPSFG